MRVRFTLSLTVLVATCLHGQEAPVADWLRALPNASGVCVIVGLDDPALPLRIAESGPWIIHGLAVDAGKMRALRSRFDKTGRTGQVIVDTWKAPVLPYQDHTANLVIAVSEGVTAKKEVLRILAPGGTAWIRKNGVWASLRKPQPDAFDEWTHWRHGPDGNMVSGDRAVEVPTGIRWIAGPAQDHAGRKWYYDHVLLSTNGRNFYLYEKSLVARDAYNGSLLWTRAMKPPIFRESGTPVPPDPAFAKFKQARRTSKVRPVAVGDQLFAATGGKIIALNARTGDETGVFGEVQEPRELLVDSGMLVVSERLAIRAWNCDTRKPAWKADLAARRMVSGDRRLLVVTAKELISLDLATGREQWRTPDADAAVVLTCTAHQGLVVLEKSTLRDDAKGCGIKVYTAKDGKLLWTRNYAVDMTHFREARACFACGLLWIQGEAGQLLGLDPFSGKQRKQWKTRGKHCATPVATERFYMAPECDFTDLETGATARARMFKNACRLPFIPANGLLYTFPVQCECYPMLRGYMGLSARKQPEMPDATPRHQPAAAVTAAAVNTRESETDWPTYRHDVWRSGATPVPLARKDMKVTWKRAIVQPPAGPLAEEWQANPFVNGPLTPLTAANGAIFVAVPDRNRIVALDAKTGALRWHFTAGGRIDGPPTIADGLCLFGAHDGWTYAVGSADGVLRWRLRLAPRNERLPAYGQMESPWPVVGSVLVDRGTAYAVAGRHPLSEGAVRVVAFTPRTGETVREWTLDHLKGINTWYSPLLPNTRTKIGLDFEPVDLLVRDGEKVSMSRWQLDPATGASKLELASVTYQAPKGLKVPRGLWGYGTRQTKLVQPKPPAVFGPGGIRTGAPGDVALLLAGGVLVAVNGEGEVRIGDRPALKLEATPVHDGLISACGALFVATQEGTVVRFE